MTDFGPLGPLMLELHQEFIRIYYLMLPIFFALSVAITWLGSAQGSMELVDVLKRTVISTLLLAALPEISQAIIFVADGIAERIDHKSGIDEFLHATKEKSMSFTFTKSMFLLHFGELLISVLTFVSYVIVYIARYLTIAMYHFFWIFYMISAPLLLLFNIFPATSQITKNLFFGMCEVASWKIVWGILGAMLSALSFGDLYSNEQNYLVLIVMNFVIAVSMLKTPSIVKALVSGGIHSMEKDIANASFSAMAAVPANVVAAKAMAVKGISKPINFGKKLHAGYQQHQAKKREERTSKIC